MKNNCAIIFTPWAVLGALVLAVPLLADQAPTVERVFLKQGALFMVEGGKSLPVTNDLTLPHGIKVTTNGTFQVQEGKERPLLEGQELGADGMLTSPDGTLRPVFDHIAFVKGQPMIMKDGDLSPVENYLDLPDGRRITPDGYVTTKSGAPRKLLDGETIELTGKALPATDTITLKDGAVIVQKDGSSFEVPPGRTLMMNDGTKVFGDGTILMKDGTKKDLSPGEIVKVEGVEPKN